MPQHLRTLGSNHSLRCTAPVTYQRRIGTIHTTFHHKSSIHNLSKWHVSAFSDAIETIVCIPTGTRNHLSRFSKPFMGRGKSCKKKKQLVLEPLEPKWLEPNVLGFLALFFSHVIVRRKAESAHARVFLSLVLGLRPPRSVMRKNGYAAPRDKRVPCHALNVHSWSDGKKHRVHPKQRTSSPFKWTHMLIALFGPSFSDGSHSSFLLFFLRKVSLCPPLAHLNKSVFAP